MSRGLGCGFGADSRSGDKKKRHPKPPRGTVGLAHSSCTWIFFGPFSKPPPPKKGLSPIAGVFSVSYRKNGGSHFGFSGMFGFFLFAENKFVGWGGGTRTKKAKKSGDSRGPPLPSPGPKKHTTPYACLPEIMLGSRVPLECCKLGKY